MLPQSCFSENTVRMGTGAIKAKLWCSCLQFLMCFLIIIFLMLSHSIHLSNEEAHFKGTRQGVCLLCLHPMHPVLVSFPTERSRCKKNAGRDLPGDPLGFVCLFVFSFPPGSLWGYELSLLKEWQGGWGPQHPGLMGNQMKVL